MTKSFYNKFVENIVYGICIIYKYVKIVTNVNKNCNVVNVVLSKQYINEMISESKLDFMYNNIHTHFINSAMELCIAKNIKLV